jgi:hypothetical protein
MQPFSIASLMCKKYIFLIVSCCYETKMFFNRTHIFYFDKGQTKNDLSHIINNIGKDCTYKKMNKYIKEDKWHTK